MKMKTSLFMAIETAYVILYFMLAVIAGLILYPMSFLSRKNHFEESGYDVWNMYFMKFQMNTM